MGPEPGADDYKKNGFISSYSINPKTGALTFLNKVDAGGGGSCHLVVDKTGKTLFVANYGSGNIASFAIKADGSIGEADRLRSIQRWKCKPGSANGTPRACGCAFARRSLPVRT